MGRLKLGTGKDIGMNTTQGLTRKNVLQVKNYSAQCMSQETPSLKLAIRQLSGKEAASPVRSQKGRWSLTPLVMLPISTKGRRVITNLTQKFGTTSMPMHTPVWFGMSMESKRIAILRMDSKFPPKWCQKVNCTPQATRKRTPTQSWAR